MRNNSPATTRPSAATANIAIGPNVGDLASSACVTGVLFLAVVCALSVAAPSAEGRPDFVRVSLAAASGVLTEVARGSGRRGPAAGAGTVARSPIRDDGLGCPGETSVVDDTGFFCAVARSGWSAVAPLTGASGLFTPSTLTLWQGWSVLARERCHRSASGRGRG